MSKHRRPELRRKIRRVDRLDQLKAGLVIALCTFTVFAVICGLLYDKSRLA